MLRNIHLWLPAYLRQRRSGTKPEHPHVFFCLCDHFEPLWGKPSRDVARRRVQHWLENYPRMADRFRDADGRPPQHTWFFPAEEYAPEYLDPLATLCRRGYGEVELHLHHDNDTADNLKSQISQFKSQLQSHGFLSGGRYAFIHGNWSLCNSRPDGRWCGVNDELKALRDTGCYADFTLPSAPSPTQTRKINSIYYATSSPLRPKSHDTGVDARVGGQPAGDLLLIQGPLALDWDRRKWGLLPRIENADVSAAHPATPARARNWVRQRIGVAGKPDWIFVKAHTHGCQEPNFPVLFDGRLHEALRQPFRLHYVTAREMFNLAKAAEAGQSGEPEQFRNFVLSPPPVCGRLHGVSR
jgi:hypothetical protein